MYKYIITHEKLTASGKEQDFIVSALYDENRKMTEVSLNPAGEESVLGNIYIGRVENVVKNLNAAFIRIAPDQICYYPLEDFKNPVFTKKLPRKKQSDEKISSAKPLVAGEELVVQVSREAQKTKEPAVTTNLTFTGKYAVLTTGNKKIGISAKLNKTRREHFLTLLKDFSHPDFGLIIRTNAGEASDAELMAEIGVLEEQWQNVKETARFKTCYTCLKKESAAYFKELKDLPEGSLSEIITDDRSIFEELCSYYGIEKDALMTKGTIPAPVDEVLVNPLREPALGSGNLSGSSFTLRYYQDALLTLSSLYSVKSSLENALKERVWLKSGAYLVIQPTEALTVIDVNSGKNIARKDMQENFLRINREAAQEIAYQLRLRNISGIIIVDFISLTSKEDEAVLLKELRAALKADPVKTDVVEITKLGLVEITRKKIKKPLAEICSQKKSY